MGEAARTRKAGGWYSELCFSDPATFLIPAECLSEVGLGAGLAATLRANRDLPEGWVALFNRAVALYFERVAELAHIAPRYWRAPRVANLCIVQNPERTRPYSLPFSRTSLLLYESDFDPAVSNVEHAVYQLVHAERLSRTGDIGMTWIHDLSYLLARSTEEREAFADGCRTSLRPDADAFKALAARLPLLDHVRHDDLRPPEHDAEEPTARVEIAGLTVPSRHQAEFQTVAKTFLAVAHGVMQQHYGARQRAGSDGADRSLVEWLLRAKPRVLLTDQLGGTLWDPERPDEVDAIGAVVEGIPKPAAESLIEDWTLIDSHTHSFVDALTDPDELTPPGEALDQEDGIYMHAGRTVIAYCLDQPGFKTLAEEAPPHHRMLVGARTIHEWGHLAADAGIVRVPEHLEKAHAERHDEVIAILDRIVACAPDEHRQTAESEVELLRREGYRLGDMPLQRVGDYQANLLARAFLSVGEMESYIRANVRPLLDEENVGPYLRLARHAYEYQYLSLSRMEDPFGYFLGCTWFAEDLIEPGIVGEDEARELFDAVGRLFGCYEVDTTRIRLPV